MMIRVCDKCGEQIDTEGPLGDRSWVKAAVAIDGPASEGRPKDYHRECARTVTVAEVWKRKNLVDL